MVVCLVGGSGYHGGGGGHDYQGNTSGNGGVGFFGPLHVVLMLFEYGINLFLLTGLTIYSRNIFY